jgi:hypothetical protein
MTSDFSRLVSRVGSRRGAALLGAGLVALLIVFSAPFRTFVILGAVLVLFLWLWSLYSEYSWRRRRPALPKFARQPPSVGMRTTVRHDANGAVLTDQWRFLWRSHRRYWYIGTGCPPQEISETAFASLNPAHLEGPVQIAESGARRYWWWGDTFYWSGDSYGSEDVRAMVALHERQKRRQLEHAHDVMALGDEAQPRKREPIPEEVQRFVFRRDGGHCQRCGSAEQIQFDHVIPLTMGGSNQAENLQLLCATCNREKGGRI